MKKLFIHVSLTTLLLFVLTTISWAQTAEGIITTVPDMGVSGMFLAPVCPASDLAISKEDADVFSIYLDVEDGTPYFMKLKVQSGMYIVKSGEAVIIKALGELKDISYVSTEKKSSIWVNDLVSPSEDTSVEDFRANHPVNEGEYIYMLTNMERNGGFGFTHFTGTTMRKGNFYIVSTVEPETTGIQVVKRGGAASTSLYNLQGQRVGSPVSGQIYIKGGCKFVYRAEEVLASPVAPVMTRAAKDIEDGDPVPILPGEAGDDDGF